MHSSLPSMRLLLFIWVCVPRFSLGCNVCDVGSFSTGLAQTTSAACTECAAGTYNPVVGAAEETMCVACLAGSYTALPGAGECVVCPANSTGPVGSSNRSLCVCDTGFKGANGGTCSLCDSAENCRDGLPSACPPFSRAVGAEPGKLLCSCNSGYTELPSHLQNATSLCTDCPAGAYCEGGSAGVPAVSTLCGAGTFQPGLGMAYAEDCLMCMPGKYQTGLGMTAASDCTLCGPGTYQPYFGGVDAEACVECPSGTFQEENGAMDAGACAACPAGTYQPNTGAPSQGNCLVCGLGTYSLDGAGVCSECPAGTWSDALQAPNASMCQHCPEGTYRVGTGGVSLDDCAACPLHSASPAGATGRGQCACVSPYVGGFTATDGSCTLCPEDSYRSSATGECSSCPARTFSPEGAFKVEHCGVSDYGHYVLYRTTTEIILAIPDEDYDPLTLMYFLEAMVGKGVSINVTGIEHV